MKMVIVCEEYDLVSFGVLTEV